MKPFFEDSGKLQQFRVVAMNWLRTPCVPHGNVLGQGVDCVSFVGEVYVACGAIDSYPRLDYAMDSGQHLESSDLERVIATMKNIRKIWERPEEMAKKFIALRYVVEAGDLLIFSMGKVTHHAGLAMGGTTMIHCIQGPGVCFAHLEDSTLARRVNAVYRPLRE